MGFPNHYLGNLHTVLCMLIIAQLLTSFSRRIWKSRLKMQSDKIFIMPSILHGFKKNKNRLLYLSARTIYNFCFLLVQFIIHWFSSIWLQKNRTCVYIQILTEPKNWSNWICLNVFHYLILSFCVPFSLSATKLLFPSCIIGSIYLSLFILPRTQSQSILQLSV